MNPLLTEDQRLLRDTLRQGLAKVCPVTNVRAVWHNPAALRPLWREFANLGLLGILVPEDFGGLGMTEVELAVAMEEVGYAAAPGPLLEAAAIAVPSLLGIANAPANVLEASLGAVIEGAKLVTAGTHPSDPIAWAEEADFCLLRATSGPRLLARADYSATPQPSVDACRRTATVSAQGWEGDGTAPSQRAALAAAAQLIGLAKRMTEMTVEYANVRQQFGKPIGSFPAVKHHLVDAHAATEMARPLVLRAAWSLSVGASDAAFAVSMAKAAASDAAELAAKKALQVHGAIGYTTECDLHFFLKRTWALARAHGSASWHREQVAAALLDGSAAPSFC